MKRTIAYPTRRAVLAAAGALALPVVHAQGYPSRPIRVVMGAPAGSLPDVMVRLLSEEMKDDLQQPLVVDNKPGAASAIAAETVARSPADGYTLLFASDAMVVANPFIYSKLPYDAMKDFKPISLLGKTGGVVVISPKLGVKTLPELVRLTQSKPGVINYASAGVGHPTQLAMELLMKATGMKMTHVPYRGTPQAVQELISGEVGALFTGYVEAMPHIKSGRLVAVGTTGPAAKMVFPDVAEIRENVPDFNFETWFAMMAPAGTPDNVIQRLNAALSKALQSSVVKQKWFDQGVTAMGSQPAVVVSMIQEDSRKFGPLIKSLGIKVD